MSRASALRSSGSTVDTKRGWRGPRLWAGIPSCKRNLRKSEHSECRKADGGHCWRAKPGGSDQRRGHVDDPDLAALIGAGRQECRRSLLGELAICQGDFGFDVPTQLL